jgi:fructose-bisphosphate aldolase class I
VLLSGGLSEAGATELLQAVAAAAAARGAPWPVSFSFGRALQASALALWASGRASGREADAVPAARRAVEAAAAANAAAAGGTYEGPHPAAGRGELREGFRGMRDVEAEAREKKGVGQ